MKFASPLGSGLNLNELRKVTISANAKSKIAAAKILYIPYNWLSIPGLEKCKSSRAVSELEALMDVKLIVAVLVTAATGSAALAQGTSTEKLRSEEQKVATIINS